ncbi:phage head-tail joining protein [Brevundimonas subvibrioides]|uniref:Uncharacterized protein n=1 Tax=Brevundimonas subvibrioides (strain ATCC 15264 / DSM 4735 / LMG 14903 / NBRC 16000 / CB 81) TaxID=633149 RepID=D9QI94_BRESC|nr:hypothetical protein [Brevundimonas subvibrioides]ADK99396.1 hypothetical protein Bresu_0082 [Brevundimonas subvibrioides ATCC 15264]
MAEIDPQTQITALENALSSGELTVESNGDRVTYRSVADLTSALDYFRSKLATQTAAPGTRSSFGFSAVAFSRD